MAEIVLKRGRDRSVRMFHPWIFSGAVERASRDIPMGGIAKVLSHEGEMLGLGTWSPSSQISVRMVSFGEEEYFSVFDAVLSSIEARGQMPGLSGTNAMRLVNGEADSLPGVIVDRYADWAVCQFNTAGAERMKNEIVVALKDAIPGLKGIYERSDGDGRRYEGLEETARRLFGEEPPQFVEICEGSSKFLVDVREGHKTGFYLDQRDNRAIVSSLAQGRDVLNLFSYTGGFGVSAMAAGANSVCHVDLSREALSLARENTEINGQDESRVSFECQNAFEFLRKMRDSARSFDLIVLDPPKFASSKGSVMKASRGYKDINLLAMKLLRPGGILATFSCSGSYTPEMFSQTVSSAAHDAGRGFRVLKRLSQASDHPEGLFFPEGLYLKGLLLQSLQ